MIKTFRTTSLVAMAALMCSTAAPAIAAEGYMLIGYGARQKALAGSDVADSRDGMAASVNPAGIVGLERQFQFGVTALLPERGYNAVGTLTIAPGDVRSGRAIFPVPNDAYVQPIDADSAWGTVSYGNGGINTAYDFGNFKAPFGGPFGGGFAGVDLEQGFFSVVYARRFGNFSLGVAPTVAVQMLNVQGLKTLAPYSSDRYNMSDDGYDYSFGGGVRVGLEWRITDQFRFGLGGSTPMFMSAFNKYRGIINDRGKMDIPANVTVGFAYDLYPNLTLMVDWKHIFYSATAAMGNPSFPIYPGSLGTMGGPGFSWRDTDSEAVGVEWRALKDLTLRAGYAHSSAPYGSKDVTFNVLAPAITAHHVSGGFNYQITKNSSLDFAVVYAFKNTISGQEALPLLRVGPFVIPPHYNQLSNVSTWLRGTEFTVGYNYKFDAGDNSWIPTHF